MTLTRPALVFLLSLLLGPLSASAADDNARHLEPQQMVVKVSAQGDVTDIVYGSQAPAAIRDLLSANVRGWKFAPHRIDGQPVAWATMLRVWLVARPDANGFQLTVDRLDTNNLTVTHGGYPATPVGMGRGNNRGALVCADLSLGPDGKTNTIEALWVDDAPVGEDNPLMRSMRRSLGAWELTPLVVDGKSYGSGSARTSVSFGDMGGSVINMLKCEIKPRTLVGDFRLLTPVVGTALIAAPPGK